MIPREKRVLQTRGVGQSHQMLSRLESLKRDIQGPALRTEKLKESQGRYQVLKRNQDQDRALKTSHPRENQSQGHVLRNVIVKKVFQNRDHVLVHTAVGPGLGHLDTGDHALDHAGNPPHLDQIFEGFPILAGEEA